MRIGTFFGIGVYVHWTFLLLVAYVAYAGMRDGGGPLAALHSVVLILAVFVCVVLHEYGHALTARRFGVKTRDITLLPIGGMARMERIPREPARELLIAVAGPAVNVAIALVLLPVVIGLGMTTDARDLLTPRNATLPTLVSQLLVINVGLVVFNMIPAFPMDGGRVLRALLAMAMDYRRATRAAAMVGQVLAAVFALVAVLTGAYMLLLIALFVWIGGSAEARAVEQQSAIGGLRVRDAMITRFRVLPETATLDDALAALLAGSQPDFPVVDAAGRTVGVLSRTDVLRAIASSGPNAPLAGVVRRNCPHLSEDDPLDEAVEAMRGAECPLLPVTRGDSLVGLMTLENVGELIMARDAAERYQASHRAES